MKIKQFSIELNLQNYRLMYLRMRYSMDKAELAKLAEKIRMEEFLIFCQTGKFPE